MNPRDIAGERKKKKQKKKRSLLQSLVVPGCLQSPADDSAARNGEDDIFGSSVNEDNGVSSHGQQALHLDRAAHVLRLTDTHNVETTGDNEQVIGQCGV